MVGLLEVDCGSRRIYQASVSKVEIILAVDDPQATEDGLWKVSSNLKRSQSARTHLVTDDENVLLPLKFHDNWLEPHNDIPVGLPPCRIQSRVELIFTTRVMCTYPCIDN